MKLRAYSTWTPLEHRKAHNGIINFWARERNCLHLNSCKLKSKRRNNSTIMTSQTPMCLCGLRCINCLAKSMTHIQIHSTENIDNNQELTTSFFPPSHHHRVLSSLAGSTGSTVTPETGAGFQGNRQPAPFGSKAYKCLSALKILKPKWKWKKYDT